MAEETDRVNVSTYVPAYQRDRWRDHADRLGMSQSEFVRTMVQAGRRGFDPDGTVGDGGGGENGESEKAVEARDRDATPGGDGLETRIEAVLSSEGPLEWDELIAELTGDVEERADEALSTLQDENRVRHSGRGGGYRLVGTDDGE